MPAVRHCSRIETSEVKLKMERSLGPQKSENYFNLVTRYLSLKLGKSEFDKLCTRLIGRENIRLHNELIRAILKNAAVCNTPSSEQVKHNNLLTLKDLKGGLQSICRDVLLFPQSPRKVRTPNLRERKCRDRPSPVGLDDRNLIDEGIKLPIEVNSEQYALNQVTAPFGINIRSNGTRKVSCNDSASGCYTEACHYSGQFLSRISLENRLKHKLKMEGLDISVDCVNLLNNGLDSYLKRVVRPSLELASSRSLYEPKKRFTTSLLDFQMATLTNPKMLGEDWSREDLFGWF